MLRELRIRNFTIVDELSISFEPGLNILSGETGAGKSIIVDAVGILLGEKASQDMIKSGEKEAYIEAYFDNTGHPLLKELSIESDEGILLRRSITSQGKGRAYINDVSAGLQTLAAVGRSIVTIHGQHEHQGLLKKDNHLSFLDAYGGMNKDSSESPPQPRSKGGEDSLVARCSSFFSEAADLRSKVAAMKARIRERSQRIEFLRFQINEIDSAGLQQGEKEAIEEERAILLNLSKLKEASETAYMLLYEAEGSALEKLSGVASRTRDIAQIDHEARELLTSLESAVPVLEDSAIILRKLKDKYDVNPQKLGELEDRLELIKRLEKKYGEGVDGILKYRETADEELKGLEHIDEQLGILEAGLEEKEKELTAAAEELSSKRHSAAKKMEGMVTSELKDLGFQKAAFKIDIKKKDAVSANGMDDVEILFSANPGEPPRPLAKVASGGELSRIMLALECLEINQKTEGRNTPPNPSLGKGGRGGVNIPDPKTCTLIFDEVDAGVGGVTARHVGKRLKNISANYQVFCITHLPQIAALADHHMKVEKAISKDNVKVSVEPLTGHKREEELARMLSGKITDSSLKHAKELLDADRSAR